MLDSLLAFGSAEALTVVNCMLFLFGGVATFIVGMNMMGNNLESAAGKSMRKLMGKATKTAFWALVPARRNRDSPVFVGNNGNDSWLR